MHVRGCPSAEPAHEFEVLPPCEVLVEAGVLARHPDAPAHLVRIGVDIEAVDECSSSVGSDEGGEDPDQGRLAGAVVAEHGECRARWGGEVDPGEGVHATEPDVHILDEHS